MDAEILTREKRRRKRVSQKITLIILGANLAGAFSAVLFFSLAGYVRDTSSVGQSFAGTGNLIILLIVIGFMLGNLSFKPLDRWYERPETDLPLTPQVQRLALNNSLHSTLISFAMWMIAGSISTASVISESVGAALTIFMGMVGVAGPMTALLIYFAVERLWSREVPLFFPTGQPNDVHAFRLSMRRRLFVPSLVGLMLMVVMTLNTVALAYEYPALAPQAQAELIQIVLYRQLFLLGIAVLAAILLTLTLGRYMADAVETLQQCMADVQAGRLEARLPVTSNDEFGALAAGFNAMVEGLQQEEVVRRLFSLYVTPEVAEHAIAHGAALGGELADTTVLFSDIRGFTTMAEALGAEATIALLNRYFEAMSAAITAHGGLVNKFGGDSLLAIFGSPLNPTPDHAAPALAAARGMLAALDDFNADQRQRGEPELQIGIGIASGPVVAGNVGSEERLEYTVIGDTVNLASRLEALTKELSISLLVSAATVRQLHAPDLRPMGTVTVRGKKEPVPIYG